MDPKSVFARQRKNAEYPDAAVSWLLHAYRPTSSGMCLNTLIVHIVLGGHLYLKLEIVLVKKKKKKKKKKIT